MNMFRIYAVELVADLETGSPLRTGEYTPPDTTQLDSLVARRRRSVLGLLISHCVYCCFYTMSQKDCAELFLSDLCQISTNSRKFRHKDRKEDIIL